MLKKLVLLASLCLCGLANAQIIKGDTEVLSKVRGEKVLFTLADSTVIYTFPPADGWYKISAVVLVDESALIDEEKVLANTKLYNLEGEEIGIAKEELFVEDWKDGKGRSQKGKRQVQLIGYVFQTKIETQSVPEEVVERILRIKNRTEQEEAFEEFYEAFDFERKDIGNYRVYIIYDNEHPFAKENSFRMMVFFKDETRFIGVGSNGREIQLKKEKGVIDDDELKLFLAAKVPDKEEEALRNMMISQMALTEEL